MAEFRVPSKKLTLDDAVDIWVRRLTTREFQNRIAANHDVNPGRVNEVLKGKLHPEAKALAIARLGGGGGGSAGGGQLGLGF